MFWLIQENLCRFQIDFKFFQQYESSSTKAYLKYFSLSQGSAKKSHQTITKDFNPFSQNLKTAAEVLIQSKIRQEANDMYTSKVNDSKLQFSTQIKFY